MKLGPIMGIIFDVFNIFGHYSLEFARVEESIRS